MFVATRDASRPAHGLAVERAVVERNRSGSQLNRPVPLVQRAQALGVAARLHLVDAVPPFEVLDPVIEDAIELLLSPEEIARKRGLDVEFVRALVAKIYRAEFKRRQAPIGLRVTQKAFGKGRVVPIVQKFT